MKIKSVSGFTYYVKNINKTAKFYEMLGFEIRKREADHFTAYSNWFWIDCVALGKEKAGKTGKGAIQSAKSAGAIPYLSVDDVDAFHKWLKAKGVKSAGEPQDSPLGNREFMITDPDGHMLAIFKRK